MFNFCKKTSPINFQPVSPRGLYLAATAKVVVLYNDGASIKITPKLAEELALALPKYAALCRHLAGAE
ncbi:MAG: hypothetical protein WCK35_11185 [Chloroflexota bacterium]